MKSSRSIWRVPGMVLGLALVALASYALGWSHLLEVKKIEISAGQEQQLITSLLVPADLSVGQPMARIDTAKIDRTLAGLLWIKHKSISRNWLHGTVSIELQARTPVATFIGTDGSSHYLDSEGVDFVLPVAPESAASIPTITFASDGSEYRRLAAELVPQLPTDLVSAMQSLRIVSPTDAIMVTATTGFKKLTIHWGDASAISLKVNELRHLLALPENSKITYVDLSTPASPLVK